MNQMQSQVAEFHKAFGVPVNTTPTIPDFERLVLRCKLILEEAFEFCDACGVDVRILDNHDRSACSNLCMSTIEFKKYAITQPDLKAIADASTDLKYVTFGADIELGFDAQPLFDEVHKSNMSKAWDSFAIRCLKKDFDGTVENISSGFHVSKYAVKRADGKILKSPDFQPPDIQLVLDQMKGE